MIKLAIVNKIITAISCYAPQVGLNKIIKHTFYEELHFTMRKVGVDEALVIYGDLKGHIAKLANGYESAHIG